MIRLCCWHTRQKSIVDILNTLYDFKEDTSCESENLKRKVILWFSKILDTDRKKTLIFYFLQIWKTASNHHGQISDEIYSESCCAVIVGKCNGL